MAPKKNNKGKKKSSQKVSAVTIEELLEQGSEALANMDLESAREIYSQALSMAPQDTNVMDALADVQIQLGEEESALELLLQSTSLEPSENPCKWFFLGQLQSGMESVDRYRAGIHHLTTQLEQDDCRPVLVKQLARAHCSIAEIYLTDLWEMEDGATATCEKEIRTALELSPDCLDGLQTLASLRMSQGRKREAGEIMARVYEKVRSVRDVLRARTVIDELQRVPLPAKFEDLPEMSFCIATLQLLIECAETTHALYQSALDLGSSLIEDDDENVQLWYLMGVASLGTFHTTTTTTTSNTASTATLCSTVDLEGARWHFDRARAMLEKLREDQIAQQGAGIDFSFQAEMDAVMQQLHSIDAHCGHPGSASGVDDVGNEMVCDEEWQDESDD